MSTFHEQNKNLYYLTSNMKVVLGLMLREKLQEDLTILRKGLQRKLTERKANEDVSIKSIEQKSKWKTF